MSLPPSLASPLGRYLQSVSPDALGMLMSSINRERRRGATPSEIETLIIATARKLVTDGEIFPPRHPGAQRRLFAPLDPFLVDGAGLKKHEARIERRSLQGIWTWLERDLLPGRFTDLVAEIDGAIAAGDEDHAEVLVDAVREEAVSAIQTAIRVAGDGDVARMRLAMQAGGRQPLDDAIDFAKIVEHRSTLQLLDERLPGRIADLNETHLERCLELIESTTQRAPGMCAHAVAIVMRRLDKPVQLVRLAVHEMASDDARRLKGSRYAIAGNLLLYDAFHAARSATRLLEKSAPADEVWMHLFDYYTIAHGLRIEVELPRGDSWTNSLGRASRMVSERLGPLIASAPRLVKAALLPRGGAPVHTPDDADLAAAEYAIAMLQQTRAFISELALNDVLSRTTKELDHYVSTIGDFIVERLQGARPDQRNDAEALLRGTVRLTRAAAGDEMAELIQRAGSAALGRTVQPRTATG